MKVETFKISEIRQLAERMGKAGLEELAITYQEMSLRMRFTPIPLYIEREAPGQEVDNLTTPITESDPVQPVIAQGPGYFLRQHPAHRQEYVGLGEAIKTGDLLGVVKMGQVYLPVYSPFDGQVVEIMATESVVEYGQAVVLVQGDSVEIGA